MIYKSNHLIFFYSKHTVSIFTCNVLTIIIIFVYNLNEWDHFRRNIWVVLKYYVTVLTVNNITAFYMGPTTNLHFYLKCCDIIGCEHSHVVLQDHQSISFKGSTTVLVTWYLNAKFMLCMFFPTRNLKGPQCEQCMCLCLIIIVMRD